MTNRFANHAFAAHLTSMLRGGNRINTCPLTLHCRRLARGAPSCSIWQSYACRTQGLHSVTSRKNEGEGGEMGKFSAQTDFVQILLLDRLAMRHRRCSSRYACVPEKLGGPVTALGTPTHTPYTRTASTTRLTDPISCTDTELSTSSMCSSLRSLLAKFACICDICVRKMVLKCFSFLCRIKMFCANCFWGNKKKISELRGRGGKKRTGGGRK
jgi:hypothetical protein